MGSQWLRQRLHSSNQSIASARQHGRDNRTLRRARRAGHGRVRAPSTARATRGPAGPWRSGCSATPPPTPPREPLSSRPRPFTEISHSHVATLFEVGEHHDYPYLVYEFVPGDRLGELAAGRPLNLRRAVDLITQVADGLAEAHAFGLRHGALTPNAIVVTPEGPREDPRFRTFGMAAGDAGAPHGRAAGNRGTWLGPAAWPTWRPNRSLARRPTTGRTCLRSGSSSISCSPDASRSRPIDR